MINVFQPALGADELAALGRVFQSNWLGKGKLTAQFETDFATHLGVARNLVRSVNCCTEGLFQAIEVLGIGAGDEVILPTISFVGAANAIAARGAVPVFCDVDRRTLNATPETIAAKLTPRTKAALILHYGGLPGDLDGMHAVTSGAGITLIEDAACSVATRYKGRGAGTIGEIGVWSFDAMKILVTGDGAMTYWNTPELAQRAEEMMYLGMTTKSGFTTSVDTRWWEFDISCYGRRSIMNDISSAMGLEQLRKLPDFIRRRREIHERYDTLLADLPWMELPPPVPAEAESSYYFYWLQMAPERRDQLAGWLRERGIYTTFRYYPLHWVAHYGAEVSLPEAEAAARSTLCIPIHQSLSDNEVAEISDRIHEFGRMHV